MKKIFLAFLVSAMMIMSVALSARAEDVYTSTVYTNGVYKVSANVPYGSVIIFACYEDGAMTFVDFVTYTAENADSIEFTVDEEIAYDSAKVFVWDGFSGMNAVKNPEIVNVTKITPLTEFAVIDSLGEGFNDKLEYCNVIFAYTSESNDPETFFVDSDTVIPELARGDVVVIGFGADGEVIEVKKLYTPGNSQAAVEAMWNAEKTDVVSVLDPDGHYLKTGIEAFDSTYNSEEYDHWARVGFGILIDRDSDYIGVMKAHKATASEASIQGADIEVGDYISDDRDCIDLELAIDLNVYVYDYSLRESHQLSKGSISSLTKTFVAETQIIKSGAREIYNWKKINRINYVFYKVTDFEVTDIMIIKAKY